MERRREPVLGFLVLRRLLGMPEWIESRLGFTPGQLLRIWRKEVDQLDGLVAGKGEKGQGRVKSAGAGEHRWLADSRSLFAGLWIPGLDGAATIPAPHGLAAGAEGHTSYPVRVPLEDAQGLTAATIPQMHRLVITGAG